MCLGNRLGAQMSCSCIHGEARPHFSPTLNYLPKRDTAGSCLSEARGCSGEKSSLPSAHHCLDEPPESRCVLRRVVERRGWLQREPGWESSKEAAVPGAPDSVSSRRPGTHPVCFRCSRLILVRAFTSSLPSSGDVL